MSRRRVGFEQLRTGSCSVDTRGEVLRVARVDGDYETEDVSEVGCCGWSDRFSRRLRRHRVHEASESEGTCACGNPCAGSTVCPREAAPPSTADFGSVLV